MRGRGGRGGHGHGGHGFHGGGSYVAFERYRDEEPEDTSEARSYIVTPDDASGPLSPRYTREVAEKIAGQAHELYDGREWLRPDWWVELRDVNPQKPLASNGWWRDIREGERLWIPDYWPMPASESASDAGSAEMGKDARQITWVSLAEMEARAPYIAPLAKYFRGTPDPEGFWRGYRNNLAPHLEAVAPGDTWEGILEISAQGFYMAIPGASGPVGWRKATDAELHHFQPDALRKLGGVTFWVEPAFGVEPDSKPSGQDTGAEDEDAGALTHRENLTQQTYAVHRGEGMFDIARKFGASSRPRWFAELRDANPSKQMAVQPKTGKQLGWQSLDPGEIVNVPDVWVAANSSHARPAPGGSPSQAPYAGLQTFPPVPRHGAYPSPTAPPGTTPAAATVDPGTILRVQGILVAFRHAHPADVTPADFGEGLPVSRDCLGVMTPRTQQALSSFQMWSNKQGRFPMDEKRGLRTDGVLDPATIAALDSFSAQALGGLTHRPPVVVIPGGELPRRPGDTILTTSVIGAAGAATDKWADVFRGSSPPPGADVPPRKPGVPAPLHELPEVLERNAAPGVPSLPPGAPHGPRGSLPSRPEAPKATLQVPPEVYDRLKPLGPRLPEEKPPARARDEEPPARVRAEKPPAKARKEDDDVLVPMALAGLSLLTGVL
jgi:hypothetical protein